MMQFDVRWFGATGDGTTDDTDAIRACVNAAISQRGEAYFPAGVYRVRVPSLVWSGVNGLTIRGESRDTAILHAIGEPYTAGGYSVAHPTEPSAYGVLTFHNSSNVRVASLGIRGAAEWPNSPQRAVCTDRKGVMFRQCNSCSVEGCDLSRIEGEVLYADGGTPYGGHRFVGNRIREVVSNALNLNSGRGGAHDCELSDNEINGFTHSAIHFGGTRNVAKRNRITFGRTDMLGATCILVNDSEDCVVEDNEIVGVDLRAATVSIVSVWPGAGAGLAAIRPRIRRNRFVDCRVCPDDPRCGMVTIYPSPGQVIDGAEVAENSVTDCSGTGVNLAGEISGSVRVESNRVRGLARGVRVHSSVPVAAQVALDWNQYSGVAAPEVDER